MKGRIIGFAVLGVIVVAALVWQLGFRGRTSPSVALTGKATTVKGYVGSEKAGFLEDEAVKGLLRRKYGLVVDYAKAGSIEMVRSAPHDGTDFLWPSSEIPLEMYRAAHDNVPVKSEIIFSSPIVLYSWDIVAKGLAAAGIVSTEGQTLVVSDFPRLLTLCVDGRKWSEIGVGELYGKVAIISTDPNKSNSGMMFAGLAGDVLRGDVLDEAGLDAVMPRLKTLFARLGYMENSTGTLFEQYLRTGVGSCPLIAGYENQIVEFSLQQPQQWERVKDIMRVLYPHPTVWSSHPLIALTPAGERLMTALKDPEIQRLAWERHGFRTGIAGARNDAAALHITGIAESVTKVVAMPTAAVMDHILTQLQGGAS
ncbi:MAG TPA: hypothetical protein VHE79_00030 [Spirochaetia bacterium]